VNNTVWVDQDYFFVMKFNRPVIDSLYLPMGETEFFSPGRSVLQVNQQRS